MTDATPASAKEGAADRAAMGRNEVEDGAATADAPAATNGTSSHGDGQQQGWQGGGQDTGSPAAALPIGDDMNGLRNQDSEGHDTASHGGEKGAEEEQIRGGDDGNDTADEGENGDGDEEEEEEEEEEDDDDDDEEPWFKSESIAKNIPSIYRNGDAASCLVVSGDKMVIGTHNGCIHVISASNYDVIRSYRPHRATVTSIAISPFPHSTVIARSPAKHPLETLSEGRGSSETDSVASSRSSRTITTPKPVSRPSAPASPRTIYVASSSVEGNVCVASLSDPKDIMLRNFGRPVHAVALSPDYSRDRTFLSGGTAGCLVLTTGGRIGGRSDATILETSQGLATPSGWLQTLGIAANRGKDTIIHDGEGTINTIRWSQSGKYVMWVNEEGIKIMRSNIALPTPRGGAADLAWKRLSHIDRPRRSEWNDMAGSWRARAEWASRESMEVCGGETSSHGSDANELGTSVASSPGDLHSSSEKLIVGWGGTIWVVDVSAAPAALAAGATPAKHESVTISTILRTDAIISGISLYTPNVLLVLAYVENDGSPEQTNSPPRRNGLRNKQQGQQPELRLIDMTTRKQIVADAQDISRYQTLSSSDYHLGVIPPPTPPSTTRSRSALDTLWDATVVQPTKLISSAASIRTTFSSPHGMLARRSSLAPSVTASTLVDGHQRSVSPDASPVAAAEEASKIVILSPYDCLFARKRGLSDRLIWLEERQRYEDAWHLLDEHSSAATSAAASRQATPKKTTSVASVGSAPDTTTSEADGHTDDASDEKSRIGELWLSQLLEVPDWKTAGEVCGRVLQTPSQWEHWITKFVENDKFDDITPYIPPDLTAPLPPEVYEVILRHYVAVDRFRMRELLEQWPSTIFDPAKIISAIEAQMPMIEQGTQEWNVTISSLAQLYLAGGRYRQALRCYIELSDAETAMALVRQYHLAEAVGEDIRSILSLHVTPAQMKTCSREMLEAATSGVIRLLVDGAASGIVRPDAVFQQLQEPMYRPFLYFYIKAMWQPPAQEAERPRGRFHRHLEHDAGHTLKPDQATGQLRADERRAVLDGFADVVVEIFAEFDRTLLMDFLQSSTAYSYDLATAMCEAKRYTRELIFLLSKTGETKRALSLILSDLDDVSAAIAFAKQQDDPDLWEDLLSYSMDKPDCIRCLLKEAGTIINPISLVRRIPSGLEIEGLRDGLLQLLREHDIQASINEGVARVLVGEVATRMQALRKARRRGLKVNAVGRLPAPDSVKRADASAPANTTIQRVASFAQAMTASATVVATQQPPEHDAQPLAGTQCAGGNALVGAGETHETLIVLGCGHVFHASHLDQPTATDDSQGGDTARSAQPLDRLSYSPLNDAGLASTRTIGSKVTAARLLQDEVRLQCSACKASASKAAP
ncbi:Vacuolar protein sorting-associated protein 41 [Ascosphaera acerosa]|nr:Vacuolar protein sorting-associated protein 41 [Ascosphaera acerosa]